MSGEMIYNGMSGDGKRLYDPLYKDSHGSRTLKEEVRESREIILQAWQNNLMLMIANGGQMTAHEVASRDEKIIQAMGPYIIVMFADLTTIIDRIFDARLRSGAYDPMPAIFDADTDMETEFLGILAKAHKKLAAANITMYYTEALATVGQVEPEKIKAVINSEEALRFMGDARAVPHSVINTREQVEESSQVQAQQMQQQQLLEAAPGLAKAAKDATGAMTEAQQNDQSGVTLAA